MRERERDPFGLIELLLLPVKQKIHKIDHLNDWARIMSSIHVMAVSKKRKVMILSFWWVPSFGFNFQTCYNHVEATVPVSSLINHSFNLIGRSLTTILPCFTGIKDLSILFKLAGSRYRKERRKLMIEKKVCVDIS